MGWVGLGWVGLGLVGWVGERLVHACVRACVLAQMHRPGAGQKEPRMWADEW